MLNFRGFVEGMFEVFYSMTCFNLVFYFSIMYKCLINATVYKNRDDAVVLIPFFSVFVPYLMCTAEYFIDNISFMNFIDYNGQLPNFSLWPISLYINFIFVVTNFFISRSNSIRTYYSIPLFNWNIFDFNLIQNTFLFLMLQLLVYWSVQSIGNQKL